MAAAARPFSRPGEYRVTLVVRGRREERNRGERRPRDRGRWYRRAPSRPNRPGARRFAVRPSLARLHLPTGDVPQSLIALALNSTTSFIAGATLGAITGTLKDLPGLLVMIPAAIGLRGNVFSALGSRLSTTVHLGTFRLSARRDSVVGQNIAAAMVLTLGISLLLSAGAAVLVLGLGISDSPRLWSLALVSILGGAIASIVVLGVTILLTLAATRFGWDLDNLVAPIVSTMGDVLTIPALFLAAQLVGIRFVSPLLSTVLIVATIVLSVLAWRTPLTTMRRIVRESAPVLAAAAGLSTLAGVALEKRLAIFEQYGALFVLQPAFVSSAGALGGILSSRLSTSFNLGTIEPEMVPDRPARQLGWLVLGLALPVAVFNALGAQVTAMIVGATSPGVLRLLAVSLIAGLAVMLFVLAVAYYGTVAASRFGLDPDTHGIPLVTSSVDFVGVLALIVAVVSLGIV